MCGVALNRLKMSSETFYETTPAELHWALEDYADQLGMGMKFQYEVARWTILNQWNMSGRSLKHTLKNPKDVVVFPWETEDKKPQSVQEMKQQLLNIAQTFKNRGK